MVCIVIILIKIFSVGNLFIQGFIIVFFSKNRKFSISKIYMVKIWG